MLNKYQYYKLKFTIKDWLKFSSNLLINEHNQLIPNDKVMLLLNTQLQKVYKNDKYENIPKFDKNTVCIVKGNPYEDFYFEIWYKTSIVANSDSPLNTIINKILLEYEKISTMVYEEILLMQLGCEYFMEKFINNLNKNN